MMKLAYLVGWETTIWNTPGHAKANSIGRDNKITVCQCVQNIISLGLGVKITSNIILGHFFLFFGSHYSRAGTKPRRGNKKPTGALAEAVRIRNTSSSFQYLSYKAVDFKLHIVFTTMFNN